MQYYIKFFNTKTNELVGFYKESGKNSVSKLMKGIKYFNSLDEALLVCNEYDDAIIRDKDGHYYNAYALIYGDTKRLPMQSSLDMRLMREEEMKNALDAFIRQNRSQN